MKVGAVWDSVAFTMLVSGNVDARLLRALARVFQQAKLLSSD